MRMPATNLNRGHPWGTRERAAFTLTELLVVMGVIAIMAGLLLSALQSAKEKSRSVMCRSNMKQLAFGFHMYADENSDYFPWAGGQPDRANRNPHFAPDWCAGGQSPLDIASPARWRSDSFGFHAEAGSVFPYVMSQKRMEYDESHRTVYRVYRCPSTGELGEALRVNFAANAWLNPNSPFGDGIVGEKGVLYSGVAYAARKILLVNEDPVQLSGAGFVPTSGPSGSPVLHLDRVNVNFVDGHIEAVSQGVFRSMQTDQVQNYYNLGK